MGIVHLIRLVRNLSLVAHYWTQLQQANHFVIDILQRLTYQLEYIIEAVQKFKNYCNLKLKANMQSVTDQLAVTFKSKQQLITEICNNIAILQDEDEETQRYKRAFLDKIGYESIQQLNTRIQAMNPQELKKEYPTVREDFLRMLKIQLNHYVLMQLKKPAIEEETQPTSEFMFGGLNSDSSALNSSLHSIGKDFGLSPKASMREAP